MTVADSFHTLDAASYGAYVMDERRRILFWNRSAERILGHRPEEVMGRQCYEVLLGLLEQPSPPTCGPECLTVSLAETGRVAPVARVRMRCASGARKRVDVMALHVPFPDTPVLVHLLYEPSGEASARGIEPSAQVGHTPPVPEGPPETEADAGLYGRLTSRELEVVRLLAAGETGRSIGGRLHLSGHTVENHIRNAREKLHAATRLELVLTAQRLGLVQGPATGPPRKDDRNPS